MRPSYFVIELSARWLIALVVALALSLIMAFAFGYGAAYSVLSTPIDEQPDTVVTATTPTPTPIEERVGTTPTPKQNIQPTATSTPKPKKQPTATPTKKRAPPAATATVRPAPKPGAAEFYVQIIAGSVRKSLGPTERKLSELGFDSNRQQIIVSTLGNGNKLYKLRIGPFPNRESADRVALRMHSSGFKDAWVVVP